MATSLVKLEPKKYEARNAELRALIDSTVVRDADSCLLMKTIQRDIRSEMKTRHFVLDPFVQKAKDGYDDAKQERSKWIDPLEALDSQAAQKVKDYERLERERAAAEERRINDERRKKAEQEAAEQRKRDEQAAAEARKAREKVLEQARRDGEITKRELEKAKKLQAEIEANAREQAARDAQAARDSVQDVKVQAAIPTVAGVPSTRHFSFKVLDINKIPRQFLYPTKRQDGTYDPAKFPAIGDKVRGDKNPKQTMAEISGIEVYED